MRKGYVLVGLGVVLLTGVGCDPLVLQLPPEVLTPAPTAATNLQFATETVARLRTLSIGQSRAEVVEKMHAATVTGCVEWSWEDWEFYLRHHGYLRCIKSEPIPSPYRTETFESGGGRYELLLYYTGGMSPSGRITAQQLTPVLIGDGRLVGWGWDDPLIRQLGPSLSENHAAAGLAPSVGRSAGATSGAGEAPPKEPR